MPAVRYELFSITCKFPISCSDTSVSWSVLYNRYRCSLYNLPNNLSDLYNSTPFLFILYCTCPICERVAIISLIRLLSTTILISINDFTLKTTKRTNKILEIDSVVKVELSYPKIQHYISLFDTPGDDAVYDVVVECISKIYTDDEVFVNTKETYGDVRTFIDNLTPDQFEKFEDFFINMPILYKKLEFTCGSCEKMNTLLVDSITNFFV